MMTNSIRSLSDHHAVRSGLYDMLCGLLINKGVTLLILYKNINERMAQRHALSQLDDRLLNDIGVSKNQAKYEISKRPWQK